MGNLNKFELHACGQQLATSFATLLLTILLLCSILLWGIVINFKALSNEKLKTNYMILKLQGSGKHLQRHLITHACQLGIVTRIFVTHKRMLGVKLMPSVI